MDDCWHCVCLRPLMRLYWMLLMSFDLMNVNESKNAQYADIRPWFCLFWTYWDQMMITQIHTYNGWQLAYIVPFWWLWLIETLIHTINTQMMPKDANMMLWFDDVLKYSMDAYIDLNCWICCLWMLLPLCFSAFWMDMQK